MLNTNIRLGSNSQEVTFNSPSTGMMQRSNPNSIFVRFQLGSIMEKTIFSYDNSTPYLKQFSRYDEEISYKKYKKTNGKMEVTVLQVLIFGDNYFMCEVIDNLHLQTNTEE
jgi:hypothetical protein